MGFFESIGFHKKIRWNDAFRAEPKFYKINGHPCAVVVLNEGKKTILPRSPQEHYFINGEKKINDWKIKFNSLSPNKVLGEAEYTAAIRTLEFYAADANENDILLEGLSALQMESILERLK